MKYYCIQEDRNGEREVVIVVSKVRGNVEIEHGQGVVPISDPDLPEWIRNPALPFDCFHEDGRVVKR